MAASRSNALLGVATLLACLLGVASAQEARLSEFRKAFLKSRDPAAAYQSRLESLGIVKGLDSVAVATALLEADKNLCEEIAGFDKFRDRLVRTGTTNKDTCEAVTVLHGLQEELRTSMMSLKEHESLLHLVVQALSNRKLPFSLRMALVGKAQLLPDEALRLCEKALKNRRDPGGQLLALTVIRGLQCLAASLGDQTIACLKSPDAIIREAAAAALVELKLTASLKPLMTRIGKERGRTRQRLAGALEILTCQSFGTSMDAWRVWSRGEGRALFDGEDDLGGGTVSEPRSEGSFFGIPLTGRAILFVVDCSVSTLLEHPEGETRLGRIVGELDRALGQLRRGQRFNIIPFEVFAGASFSRDLATSGQVPKARRWLEKRFRKRFSHNTSLAWLRYPAPRYDALELAFRFAGLPASDQYYQPGADTVFFVSDGLGGLWYNGKDIPQGTPEATVRAVRRWNVNRHVVIHAIQVGGWDDGFMRTIAAANGGRFVVDGK